MYIHFCMFHHISINASSYIINLNSEGVSFLHCWVFELLLGNTQNMSHIPRGWRYSKTKLLPYRAMQIELICLKSQTDSIYIDDGSSPFFFIGCKTMGPKLCFFIYVPSTKLPGKPQSVFNLHPMSETWATRTFVDMARSPFWSPLFFHLIIQFPSFGVLWHKEIYKRYLKHKKQYVEHHINNQVDVGTYVKHTLQQKRPPCILNNQQSWQNNWMVCWKLCNVEK